MRCLKCQWEEYSDNIVRFIGIECHRIHTGMARRPRFDVRNDELQCVYTCIYNYDEPLNIALFLKENIVGCVLFISLIIWIPGACAFHWLVSIGTYILFLSLSLSLSLSFLSLSLLPLSLSFLSLSPSSLSLLPLSLLPLSFFSLFLLL